MLALGQIALLFLGCVDVNVPLGPVWDGSVLAGPVQPPDWARVARVGGLNVHTGQGDLELSYHLNQLVAQHVTVVEVDSRLSSYLSDNDFQAELQLMGRVADLARERNLKVVWYGTSLEVVSEGGATGPSMAKDHPEWLQLSWDGKVNAFVGDRVFWVDPGDESAWLSPRSGYREYFFGRLERLATSGIDGFWLDVPLFNDIVGRWASFHPADVAAFEAHTGLQMPNVAAPGVLDPADPAARAWIAWRHEELAAFLSEAYQRARAANPEFTLWVETVTVDHNAAILEGLDGAFLPSLDGLHHVWEVDVLSDASAMRRGQPEDFASLATMYRFGAGVDEGRPGWAFVYGDTPDDAEVVMGLCVSAGLNPYELRVPEMTTTVGEAYRARVFGWIASNEDRLFRSTSAARVVLLHSSVSRDVVDGCVLDGTCGVSLYATTNNPDPGSPWWTEHDGDGLRASQYMAEYRGAAKALLEAHVPFDVRPARSWKPAPHVEVVVAPSLEAVSDAEVEALRAFAKGGGHVVFTGAAPGVATESGALRPAGAFAELFGAPQCVPVPVGDGSLRYCAGDVGRAFLVTGDGAARGKLADAAALATPVFTTTAPPGVIASARRLGDELILQFVSFEGADGSFEPVASTFEVRVPGQYASALQSSARDGERPLAVRTEGTDTVFELTVSIHELVVLK